MENFIEIISRLKFICKLNKGEKINTKYVYTQPEGVPTTISRTFWHKDNRLNTIFFIKDTINKSFSLLQNYDKSDIDAEKQLVIHLIVDLSKISKGLENLKFTYTTDTKFCCDIDTIIENIQAKLIIYQEKYNDKINYDININMSSEL